MRAVTGIAAYLALIISGIWIVSCRGVSQLRPMSLINIGVDLSGMLTGCILSVCCMLDMSRVRTNQQSFMCLLNVTYLGLFTDLVAWTVNEVPRFRVINIVDNTIYYMCLPVGCYFFWKYVKTSLRSEEPWEETVTLLMKAGLVIALLLRILNMAGGFFFTVDADGIYARAAWYPVSMVYEFVTEAVTVTLIIRQRKKLVLHQTLTLLLYAIAPFLAGILTMGLYGLSISSGIVMMVLLLMYCVLNISQSIEKAVTDRDLATAAAIQHSMMPHDFPPFPQRTEFDIYASMDPAKEVGGDFYDFFLIDQDHLCMVIADVSGKGVPASLFMMISKTILKSCAMLGRSAEEILEKTNEALCSDNQTDMFVTVWLGILEISTGRLSMANAGHEYPAFRRAGRRFELMLDKHDFVIGGMEGTKYREKDIQLERGDQIFVYTDGVTDAMNDEEELFGTKRLLDVLNSERSASPKRILENVSLEAAMFVGQAEQFDDMTMLCMEYKGVHSD